MIPLIFLTLLLLGVRGDGPPEDALELLLYRGQYIQTTVSGRDQTLRVRFDCDLITLYATTDSSNSYDGVAGTEELAFGPSKSYRWRTQYTGGARDTSIDPPATDDKITHQGVL